MVTEAIGHENSGEKVMTSTTILIVEDESILALDLEDILTSLGYTVIGTAINACQAFDIVDQFKPNLILMDVRIQGEMDGIEVAAEIWNRYTLPIVFLTASVDEKTLERIKVSPAYGYVSKPFKTEELSVAIRSALSMRG